MIFFIWLYVVIRKLKYSKYYLSVMVFVFIVGLGGTMGWNQTTGLLLMGLTYAAVLLANKDEVWGRLKTSADRSNQRDLT